MPTFTNHVSLHSVVLLLFFILHIYHSFALRHPLCLKDDRSSLLQFKQSLVFDEFGCDPLFVYTKISSWKAGDDCCSWDGVDCNNETGHVIGLDLSNSCLSGSINSSSPLFRLVHLTSLNLSSNNFNRSRIPNGIRSLTQMKHLDLSFSNFTGQIPSGILELAELVSLDLSTNPLILQKPNLKDVVETFSHLAELHLNGVNISSHVPQSLSNLTSLSSLLLERCSLQGEFPSGIFRLPYLRILNIRFNPNLSGYLPKFDWVDSPLAVLRLGNTNFSGQLPLSIGNLKSLSTFTARECYFEGLIPSSIGNLTKLNVLDLSNNNFWGSIPFSVGNLSQVTNLSLSNNNFESSTLHWLGRLTSLNILNLENINSYGPIPPSFGNLTQLSKLRLATNQITGQIPDSIFRLPNIEVISLRYNQLNGTLEMASFLKSKYLVDLQLSYNELSLVSHTFINVTLPKFQVIGLSGCNLSEFPGFLHEQHELEVLELSDNNIEGYVPNWLFALERLEFLDLSNNSLKGNFEHLPSVTLPWTHLTAMLLTVNLFEGPLPIPPSPISIFDVSHNKFSGDVSPLFCNLTSLSILSLSDNNLSGNLLPCLSNLGNSAVALNLRNNSFSGKIPDHFTTSCLLELMDLSQNKIEGEVPRSFANCSKLEILNLEENQMNDVFPSWLGVLPHLKVLSLRSNKFHGLIGKPSTEFEFNRLQIIDLSNNNFIGKLPFKYFQNWVSMKSVDFEELGYMNADTSTLLTGVYSLNYRKFYYIRIVNKGTERAYNQILEFFMVVDLSSNKFEGEIPEIIGTLRNLQFLNLSNNVLAGHIPLFLSNLKKIEALDLSQNRLSGNIPMQLSVLTFLSIFNVSHNNLTGLIPRGNQFGTFENDSFSANPGLCGHPLSKTCDNKAETLPLQPLEDEDSPFEFNLKIVLNGCVSGLVIGVAFGCALDTRKYEWIIKKKFARRLSRRCIN